MAKRYIQDETHFFNFLAKYCDGESFRCLLESKQAEQAAQLLKSIYDDTDKLNRFTYAVKQDKPDLSLSYLITFNSFVKPQYDEFINAERNFGIENFEEFKQMIIESLYNKCGVYIFSSGEKPNIVYHYVGFSVSLHNRVITSLRERFKGLPERFTISIVENYSEVDCAMLEIYLISKLKPLLNKQSKFEGESTLLSNFNPEVTT